MYREAEVTHGRVSMLAVLGFLAQEQAHFLFVEPDKDIGPAIRHLDEVRAVNPIFFEGLGFVIACAELYRSLYGWASPLAESGFGTETTPGSLNDDYYPGDVGFDPFGIKPEDAEEFAEMATKELQHGRLAASRIGTYPERLLSLATIVWPSVSSCAKKPATASMASRPCWSSLVAISANSSASSGLMPNGSNPTSPG